MRALLLCLLVVGCIDQPGDTPPDAGSRLGPLDGIAGVSIDTVWTCTGAPCPWGASLHNQAIVWPLVVGPSYARIGYTASAAAYLPLEQAEHLEIHVIRGSAQVHIGRPEDPLPWGSIAALTAGDPAWPVPVFSPALPGMLLSVESTGDQFEFALHQELP